jgi:hypothetical protein
VCHFYTYKVGAAPYYFWEFRLSKKGRRAGLSGFISMMNIKFVTRSDSRPDISVVIEISRKTWNSVGKSEDTLIVSECSINVFDDRPPIISIALEKHIKHNMSAVDGFRHRYTGRVLAMKESRGILRKSGC